MRRTATSESSPKRTHSSVVSTMRSAAREDFADIVARKRRQRLEVVEDIGPAVTGVPVAPPAAHAGTTAPEVGPHEWEA